MDVLSTVEMFLPETAKNGHISDIVTKKVGVLASFCTKLSRVQPICETRGRLKNANVESIHHHSDWNEHNFSP